MLNRLVSVVVAGALLSGCGVVAQTTKPVVVIEKSGRMLRGSASWSVAGGSFNVTDGRLSCGGNFEVFDRSPTITFPVTCSDGRRGIVIDTRSQNMQSGSGPVRMSDGTEATFMFGDAAAGF